MPHLTLQAPALAGRRLLALDELKGIAILLVVLYHAGGVLAWNNYLHGDLGVDLFVILSGIGLSLGDATYPGHRAFLRKRLLRILPAYWITLTAFLLLNTHFLQHHYTPANIVLHYLGIHGWFGDSYAMSINDSFWFITLILSLYLFYVALRRWVVTPDKLLLVGAIISVTATFAWFLTGQSGSFGHLGLRLPGFFVGLLIGYLLRTGSLALRLGPVLLGAVFLLTYVPYTRGIVFHTGVVALGLMGLYALVLQPRMNGAVTAKTRSVFKFLGDHSLEIFLLHQPLIREYNYYLHGRWFNEPAPSSSSLMIGMLVALALTLLLSYEMRRILLRFLPK